MELFRGDTFYKSVTAGDYVFQPDDILRVAILNNTLDETKLYERNNVGRLWTRRFGNVLYG